MTAVPSLLALTVPRPVVMAAGALAGGYVIGALPIAAIVLGARRVRGKPVAVPAEMPRLEGRRGNATMTLLAEGGFRIAAITVLFELLKGGIAGLGARVYDDSAVFAAFAIAGCVVGDAFPLRRPGRRGVVPLISGTFLALPGAWAAGTVIAIPALVVLVLSGAAFEGTVAICIPLALLLGTRDAAVLLPAAVMVVAIIGRNRLRRRAHDRSMEQWRNGREGDLAMLVDQPARRP
jgi:hypothetical protein